MTLSTSWVLASPSNSGLRMVGEPTRASTAVPPRWGLGGVTGDWHPASAIAAATAPANQMSPTFGVPATASRDCALAEMSFHPDVGDRAHEKAARQDPRGPVDLALETPAGAVAAATRIAAAADRPAQARSLWSLHEHSRHQQDGEDDLNEDERVFD